MQKAQNNHSKKYKIPLVSGAIAIGGMFLFSYLTFIPGQASAAEETRTLADINYMQEMNRYVCDNTTEIDKQYQLIDIRDGKKYWVTKHLDDNCWMTQNLDFDISDILTENTSNVHNIVNMGALIQSMTKHDVIAYHDAGDFVYTYSNYQGVPWDDNACRSSAISSDNCKEYFTAMTDSSDMHYHVGNFYTYNATTAGSGYGILSGDAPESICPRGWKLPSDMGAEGDFGKMLSAYGWSLTNANMSDLNSGRGIYSRPLYFVYGGVGGNSNAGSYGYYWSSTARSSTAANYLLFSDASVSINGGGR